jgi:2-phosphosulfolactate phosphatase
MDAYLTQHDEFFDQSPSRCRLDWGRRGARRAAERGDILVIVDTLSFSTTVATAVHRGGLIYPCAEGEDAEALARRVGAEVAVRRDEVPAQGRFSLAPTTCLGMEPGTRLVLPSPNGATCSRYARAGRCVLIGALVNASAVAEAVTELLDASDLCVTVIACGERWRTPSEDGELRVALEDYLGAGAILACLRHEKSPEARVCRSAFQSARDELHDLLWDCASGRELRGRGYAGDVEHAGRLDVYDAVPIVRGERIEKGWHRPRNVGA